MRSYEGLRRVSRVLRIVRVFRISRVVRFVSFLSIYPLYRLVHLYCLRCGRYECVCGSLSGDQRHLCWSYVWGSQGHYKYTAFSFMLRAQYAMILIAFHLKQLFNLIINQPANDGSRCVRLTSTLERTSVCVLVTAMLNSTQSVGVTVLATSTSVLWRKKLVRRDWRGLLSPAGDYVPSLLQVICTLDEESQYLSSHMKKGNVPDWHFILRPLIDQLMRCNH